MAVLVRRVECDNEYSDCNSPWFEWGRWVALAVIVIAAFIAFFIIVFSNARHRRSHGVEPYYGTAWLAPPPYPGPPAQPVYAAPYPAPPPQYTPNPPAYGYFGGQPTGIELQHPPHTYQPGEPIYQTPYPKSTMP